MFGYGKRRPSIKSPSDFKLAWSSIGIKEIWIAADLGQEI